MYISFILFTLHMLILPPQEDPQSWSVEQVCEWLELVGLGTYRDTFRGKSCHITLSTNGISLININLFLLFRKRRRWCHSSKHGCPIVWYRKIHVHCPVSMYD